MSYTPKAIRGQRYPGYTKVSVRQVRRMLDEGQTFDGFLVGNNVNSFHFFGGWHLAFRIEVQSRAEFDRSLNAFLFYLEPELGNRAAIFLKRQPQPAN